MSFFEEKINWPLNPDSVPSLEIKAGYKTLFLTNLKKILLIISLKLVRT